MQKPTKELPKEWCGMKVSTWAKLINVALGSIMIIYSFMTFFSLAFDLISESPVIIITFKVYEM